MFKNIENLNYKNILWAFLSLLLLVSLLFSIIFSINSVSESNMGIFSYTVKVRDTVEELGEILDRAETNVKIMDNAISDLYIASKQQNEAYNLSFMQEIDGLVKSVLVNSPGVTGSWFQINADLPFSAYTYNWYEFRDNQFINIKEKFEGGSAGYRKITPEDDPYYFEAIMSLNPVWSDVYSDVETKEQMLTVSDPVYKGNTLVGVVGIDISMRSMQSIMQNMQFVLGDSELFLLDKHNKVILSQLMQDSNSSKTDYPFLTKFKIVKEGPVQYYDNFVKKTAIMLPFSNGFKLVIAIDNKVLFPVSNQLCNLIYVMFGILTIGMLIFWAFLFKDVKIVSTKKISTEYIEALAEKMADAIEDDNAKQ